MSAIAGDSAAASVYVAISVEEAFAIFTEEIDSWWRHGAKYRIAGRQPGQIFFEPRSGGRLFETVERGSGPKTYVTRYGRRVEPTTPLHVGVAQHQLSRTRTNLC